MLAGSLNGSREVALAAIPANLRFCEGVGEKMGSGIHTEASALAAL